MASNPLVASGMECWSDRRCTFVRTKVFMGHRQPGIAVTTWIHGPPLPVKAVKVQKLYLFHVQEAPLSGRPPSDQTPDPPFLSLITSS